MTLIILDHTGHTELDLDTDAMIEALRKEMNRGGRAVLAEEPDAPPLYLRDPGQVRRLDPTTRLTVVPQLAGG